MLVKTRLIILHIDFQEGSHKCFIGDDQQLPSAIVEDCCQPIQYCSKILSEYIEIDVKWVSFVLLDVNTDQDNTLYVYYTCMIPSILKNKRGSWIEIGNIQNEYIQKIVLEAGQKLLSRF